MLPECSPRSLDEIGIGLYHFLHVVVAVLHLRRELRLGVRILFVQLIRDCEEGLLHALKLLTVVLADDVAELRGTLIALHLAEVEEALKALGVRRRAGRQEGLELHAEHDGAYHLILCGARVHVHALDVQGSGSRVEVLVLNAADLAAVHRVRDFCAESLDIKEHCALADFLVRCETDQKLAVAMLRICLKVLDQSHNLRNACLIVRTEKGAAVRDQEIVSLCKFKLREGLRRKHFAVAELNHAAVIVLDEARLHIRIARRGRGIHVCNEAERRRHRVFRLREVRGNARIDIAFVREAHVLCAQLL